METIEEFEFFANDRSGVAYHLTVEISCIGDRSVKMIPFGTSNEAKISLSLQNRLTGQPVKWIDGHAINGEIFRIHR